MSQLLEGRKEQFLKAKVNLLAEIGEDAKELMEHTVVHEMPIPAIWHLQPEDWADDVNKLVVGAAAAAHFKGETTLEELSAWLKRLAERFPFFAVATHHFHGAINIEVAKAIEWAPDEFAILTDEVRGKVMYKGDKGGDPIRDRVNWLVSRWLDLLFGVKG